MTRSQNSDGRPQFHLRRISHRTLSTAANTVCFGNRITFIGRGDNVHYLVSSAAWQQRIFLSRRHCRLVRSEADDSHRLIDSSMTGVYVNDVKIAGSCVLEEGDVVTFGHPKGDTIQAGTRVRQPDSEHQFVFEACSCIAENLPQDVVQGTIHKRHKQLVGAAPTTPEMLGTFRVPKTVPKRNTNSPAVVTHGRPTRRGGASVGSCDATPPSSRRRPQTRSQGRVAKNVGSRSSTRPSITQKHVGIPSNEPSLESDTDTETGLTNERSLAKGKPSEKDESKLVQDNLGQHAKQSVQVQSPAEPPEPPSCKNLGQTEVGKGVSVVEDTQEEHAEDYPLDLTLKYGQTSYNKEVDRQEVSQNGGELQVHTLKEKLVSTENTDNSSKVVKQPDKCSQEPTSSAQATVDEQKEGMQQTAQFDNGGNVREEPSKQPCLDERNTDTFEQQGQVDRDSAKEVVEKEPAVETKAGGDVKEDGCSPVPPEISSKDAVEDMLGHSVQSAKESLPDKNVLSNQNEEQTQDIQGLAVYKTVSHNTVKEPVCVLEHKLNESTTFQTISENSTSCEEDMQDAANRCDDPYMRPVGMSVEDHCCLQKKDNTDVLSEKQEMNETFPDELTDFPDVDATVKSLKPVEDSSLQGDDNGSIEEDHNCEKKETGDGLTDEQEVKGPFADKNTDVDATAMSPKPVEDSSSQADDCRSAEKDHSLEKKEIADVLTDEQETKDLFEDKKTDEDTTAMSPQPVEDSSLQAHNNRSVEEDHSLEKNLETADVLTDEQETKDPFADKDTDVDTTATSPQPVKSSSLHPEDRGAVEEDQSLETEEIPDVLTDEQEIKDAFEDKDSDVEATAMSPKPVEDSIIQTSDNGSVEEDQSLEKKEIPDVLPDEQEIKDPFADKPTCTDVDATAMSAKPVENSGVQTHDNRSILDVTVSLADEADYPIQIEDKPSIADETQTYVKKTLVEGSTRDNADCSLDQTLASEKYKQVLQDTNMDEQDFPPSNPSSQLEEKEIDIKTDDLTNDQDKNLAASQSEDKTLPEVESKVTNPILAESTILLAEDLKSHIKVLELVQSLEKSDPPCNKSAIDDTALLVSEEDMPVTDGKDKKEDDEDVILSHASQDSSSTPSPRERESDLQVVDKCDHPVSMKPASVDDEDLSVSPLSPVEEDDDDVILSHASQDSSITPSPIGGEDVLQVKDKCDHPVSIEPASVDDGDPSISPPSPVEENDEDAILSHASQDGSITPSIREGESDLQVKDKCDHPVSMEPASVDDEDPSVSPPSPVEENDEDIILSHASLDSSITPSPRGGESDLQVKDKCDHAVSIEPASVDDEDPSVSPPSPVTEHVHDEGITNTAMDDSTAWVLQEFEDLERSPEIPPVINAKDACQDLSQSSFISSVPGDENETEKEMIPSSQSSDREFDSGESCDSHMGILRLSPSGRSGNNATQNDVESEDMETPLSQNSTGSDFGLSGVVPFVASPTGSQEDSLEALQKEAFAEMEANEDNVTLSTSCPMQNKGDATITSDDNVTTVFKKSVTWEVTDTGLDTDAKENDFDLSMDDLEEEFGDGNSRFVVSDSIDYRAEDDNYSSDSDGSSSDEEDTGNVGGAGLGLHLSDSEVETEERIHTYSSQSVSLHKEHSSHGHVQNVKDQGKSVSGPLEESNEEKKEHEASDSSGIETILTGNFQETSTQLAKPVEERKEVLSLDEIPAYDTSLSKVLPSQGMGTGKVHNISEEEDVTKKTETGEKSQMVTLPDMESKLANPTLAESTILEIETGKLHNISEENVAKELETELVSQIVTLGTSMEIQSSQEQQDQDKANSGECNVSNPRISQAEAIDPPHKESGPKRELNVESKDENDSGKQQCEDRVKIHSQTEEESAVVDDQLTSEDSEASEVLPSAKRPHDEDDAVLPQSKRLHLDSQLEETDMIEAEGLNVIDITSEGLENISDDSLCGTVDSFDFQREVSKNVDAAGFHQTSLPIISVKSRADCVRDAVLDFFAHRFFLDKMSSKLDKIAKEARKRKVAEEVKAFFARRSLKEQSTSTDRQGCVEPETASDSNSSAKKRREDPTCKDIPSVEVDKKKVIERAVYEFFRKKNSSAMSKTENKVQTQPKKRHSNKELMLENAPEAKRQKLQEVSKQLDGPSSSNTPDVKSQILQEASQQPNVCTDTTCTQEVNNSQDDISLSENQEFKTLGNLHEDSKAKTNQGEQNTTLGHDETDDNTKVCCSDNRGLETYNANDKDSKETDISGEINIAEKYTSEKDRHELEISTGDMDIQPEQDNEDKEMVDVQDMEVCSSTESDSKALDHVIHVVASENEKNNCISSASYSAEENFERSEESVEESPAQASEEEVMVTKTLPQDDLSGKVTMTVSPKCQITEIATNKDCQEIMSDTSSTGSPNKIRDGQCQDLTEVPSSVDHEVMQSDLTEIEETSHEKPPSSSPLDNSTSPSSHTSKEPSQTSQKGAVPQVCNEVDVQEDSETDANSDLSLPSLDGYAESESDRDSNYSENETFLSPNPMDSYDESSDAESDRDSNNSENDRFLPSNSMEYGTEFDSDENVDDSDQDDKEDDSSDEDDTSEDEDDDDDKDGDSSDPESLTSTTAEKTNISSKDCPDTEQDSSVESPKAATSDKLADANEDVTMETDKQSNKMALQGLSCDFDDDDEFSAPNINLDDIDFDDDNFDDDGPSIQTSSDLPSPVTNFSPGKDISDKENRNESAVSEMAEREKSKKITNVAPTGNNLGLGTSRESAGNTTTTTTKTTPAVQSTKVSSGKDTKDKTPGVGKDKENPVAQMTEETPGVLPTNVGRTRRRLLETPGKVTTDNAPKYMEQCQAIMSSLQEALDKEPSLKDISRVQAWKKDAAKLGEKMSLPETIIAVVGDTGAGKSSLMNALLDHSSVLPTSGMRACTAVVVEVSNNERNKNYEADVEFLSRKEWDNELRLLLTDLIGEDGKAKRKPDPQSEAGIAWSKIKAVYGRVESYDVLSRLPHVRHLLGTTKHISKSRAREFRSEIDKYVDSMDAPPARGPGSRDRSGGQLWPIVKRVKVQIPNCDVCSSGAILVDLPGVRDSNAARDNIAKQYFKNCNAIWIVASIHRAVDDKTAKELLGEGFRRQLLMDGQYGSIAFICTKTDDLRCSEIIRALNLEEEVEQLENEINALEVEKMSLTEELESLKEEEEEKDDELASIQQEVNDLKEEVFELEQTVEPVDVTPDEEVIVDDDDREKLNSLRTTLEEKQSTEQEKKTDLKETRSQIADKEKEIAGVERQVCSKQRQMSVMCAKARNQYSQTQIRADFKAGIREMKRKAGMMGEDADSDDDEEEEAVEDQEEEDIARGLRVFTVSSTEYLKLTNKLTRDGPAQVFSSVHDTQIPALRQFVHEITNVRRKSGTEKLIRSLGSFVSDIASYLLDEGTKNHGTRMSAKTIFEHHLGKLKTSLEPVLGTLQTDVDRSISICIQPKLKEGVQAAASMCQAVAKKWGAPTCKENRQAGGLHYSTYKATVRRSGVYKSPTYGPIDMNEDLSSPLYNTITISWQKVFDNGTLFFALDNCKQSVLRTLKEFLLKLRTELQALGMDADRVNRVGQQQLNSTKMRLDNAVAELKEFITGQQREISRVMTPAVQNRMEPVYETCTNESGPGSFNRMRNHMGVHVAYEKDVMFDQASQFLLKHLADLEVDIVARMQVLCDQLCDDLAVLYEPFWEAPVHCTILKKHLMDDMLSIHGKVKALFEDADLQDLPPLPEPAPQPAAVNQSTTHAGYSPMNRPGSSNISTGTTPTGINSMVTPTYPLTLRIKQELMDMHSCGAATPPNQRFHFGGIRPPTQSFHFGGIRPPPVAGAMTAPASAAAGTRSGLCASGVGTPVPANIQSHQASANVYGSQPRIKREEDSQIGNAGFSTPLLNPAAVSQFRKRTLQGMTGPGNSQATAPPVLKKVKTEKGYFVTMIGQGGQILRFPVVQTLTQMQQNGSSQQTGAAVRPSLHRSATPASSHHTSSTTTKGSFGGKTGTQLSASPAPKDFVSAKSGKVSTPTYSASKPVTSQGLSSAKGKGVSYNSQMKKPTSGQKGLVGKQTPGKGGKGKGARGISATVPVARQHGGPAVRVKQEPRTPLRENQSRKKRKFQADEIIDLTLDD